MEQIEANAGQLRLFRYSCKAWPPLQIQPRAFMPNADSQPGSPSQIDREQSCRRQHSRLVIPATFSCRATARHKRIFSLLLAFAAVFISQLQFASVYGSGTLRSVVLANIRADAGDAAPGAGPGVNFRFVFSHTLASNSLTTFKGDLSGIAVDDTNDVGLFREEDINGLKMLVRTGEPAPGTGANFLAFGGGKSNGFSQTVFQGFLTGNGAETIDSTNNRGIFRELGSNGISLVARLGDVAPGASDDVKFARFERRSLAIDQFGHVAFSASLLGIGVDDSNDIGIYRQVDSIGLMQIAREGDLSPGTEAGVRFGSFDVPAFNDSGNSAFLSELLGAGVDRANDEAIYSEGGGNGLALFAREGDVVPEVGPGVTFGDSIFNSRVFGSPAINNNGELAFRGTLTGPGISNGNSGIFSGVGGNKLRLVARTGNPATGTGTNVNFDGFSSPILINDEGKTAFGAFLTGSNVDGTNNFGVFSEGMGELKLVARKGDQAPGTEPGVSFRDFETPILNSRGQIAFFADLHVPGSQFTSGVGLFAQDIYGELKLIARTGDVLDVSDDPLAPDLRTIESLSNQSIAFFDEQGHVAFWAGFSNGIPGVCCNTSGIFVSQLVAVPEPKSLVMLAMGGIVMLRYSLFLRTHEPSTA